MKIILSPQHCFKKVQQDTYTEKNPDVNTIKKLIIPIKKLLKLVRLTTLLIQ